MKNDLEMIDYTLTAVLTTKIFNCFRRKFILAVEIVQ